MRFGAKFNMRFGAQKNRLNKTVILSTHSICFGWEIRTNILVTLYKLKDYTSTYKRLILKHIKGQYLNILKANIR